MIWIDKLKSVIDRHQLTGAIILTIVIALIMTSISLSLYVSSGTLQLDLSRPGYESARKEIINPDNNNEFSASGSINQQSLEEYQKQFDSQRSELNSIGNFKDQGLSDESLTISPVPLANE